MMSYMKVIYRFEVRVHGYRPEFHESEEAARKAAIRLSDLGVVKVIDNDARPGQTLVARGYKGVFEIIAK